MENKTQRKYNMNTKKPKDNIYCVSVISPWGSRMLIRRERLREFKAQGYKLLKDYENDSTGI